MSSNQIDLSGRLSSDPAAGVLAEPLAVIQLAMRSHEEAKTRFSDYRLSRLVSARLQLDDLDMECFPEISGLDPIHTSMEFGRPFDHHLRHVIRLHGLEVLFSDDGPGPYHHAIRPTGYDFHSDVVIPTAMEQWRADYRAMAAERQMLAASIIWLYRGGKDNCWLRRVPCTWHAVDALRELKSASAIADWAGLFCLYPGW